MAKERSGDHSDSIYQPCERRFRTSSYFLEDQLRCSEALEDFRSVRNLLHSLTDFQPKEAFQFQAVQLQVEK